MKSVSLKKECIIRALYRSHKGTVYMPFYLKAITLFKVPLTKSEYTS